MAISPNATYVGQTNTTDPNYLYGRAKNCVAIGDGTGTPLEEKWVSDLFGFEQALLVEAAITPNGTPDSSASSQYLSAIKAVADKRAKLALQKSQAINWPERASFHNAGDYASPDAPIGVAWAPDLGPSIGGGRFVLIAPSNTSGCQAWSSEDANTWNYNGLQNAANQTNPSVAYGRIGVGAVSGFLMTWDNPVGHYTSTNGTSWGVVSATVPAHGVAVYAPSLGLWVIAGDSGAVSTSPTAIAGSWTSRTTPAGWIAGSGGAKRIVWNGSLFVVLPTASYNKFLSSPDAINWTERTLPFSALWNGLAYSADDGIWMATNSNASNGVVSTSGLIWAVPTGANYTIGNDLAVLGSLWVMPTSSGNYGGVAWSTDLGASWKRGPAVGNHRVATAGWNRILAADNRFMLAHADGTTMEVALSARA